MFGWDAFPYQVPPLNDKNKRVLIASGRQVGKTEMAALMGLYYAIWHEKSTVLIIAPTERQSQIVFKRMKQFINNSVREKPNLKLNSMITRETQHIIEWSNGSVIHCLPITEEGRNIRGFVAHFIILDEGAYIPEAAFSAIYPMLSTTHGYFWMIGTFKGVNNEFYRTWIDGTQRGFSVYTFPSKVNPLITPEFLNGERSRFSSLEFMQEYEAVPVDETDTYFTMKEIEDCQKDYSMLPPTSNAKYVLGFDPARMGEDSACACILEQIAYGKLTREELPWRISRIYELKNKTLNQQLGFIKKLNSIWNFEKIMVDDTGLGGGLTENLLGEGLPVEGIVFSIKSKEELYSYCKIQMQNGKIIFPRNKNNDLDGEKLKKQMNEIKFEYQKGTGFIKLSPATKHSRDDYCSALVLGLWGTRITPSPILFGSVKATF